MVPGFRYQVRKIGRIGNLNAESCSPAGNAGVGAQTRAAVANRTQISASLDSICPSALPLELHLPLEDRSASWSAGSIRPVNMPSSHREQPHHTLCVISRPADQPSRQ